MGTIYRNVKVNEAELEELFKKWEQITETNVTAYISSISQATMIELSKTAFNKYSLLINYEYENCYYIVSFKRKLEKL